MLRNRSIQLVECLLIEGVVQRMDNSPIDIDKFRDDFVEWIESKGLCFGGIIDEESDEDEEEEI